FRHLLQRRRARVRHRERLSPARGRLLRPARSGPHGRSAPEPTPGDPVRRLLRRSQRAHVPDRHQRRPAHLAVRGTVSGSRRDLAMGGQRVRCALGTIALALVATATTASAQGPVKLAIVAEITGGGAPSGTMWRDGVLLAVEEINRKGGILGRSLESFV